MAGRGALFVAAIRSLMPLGRSSRPGTVLGWKGGGSRICCRCWVSMAVEKQDFDAFAEEATKGLTCALRFVRIEC